MQVKMHAAKSQLSKLVEAAENGEEVIIARGDVPVARLVPIRDRFVFDVLADKLKGPIPDFLEPLDEEDLRLWEGGEGKL